MISRALLVLMLLGLAGPAMAGVSRAVLDAVYVDPRPGATAPLSLDFRDETGRTLSLANAMADHAAVLVFADYTCHTLCGPILEFTTAALGKSGLRPGADYRLVVVGLDPKDTLQSARAMRASHLDNNGPIARDAVFLTGTNAEVATATSALGYHFAYDAAHDQYAHPAAVFVLNRQGKVTRVLSGLGLSGDNMRLALVDAGQGKVGTLSDRFRLLCYGYDPALGIYTARISLLLSISGALTLALMAGGILLLHRMARVAS